MAGAESPPGRPGFIIRPLKPDNEVPGGGRQTWLTKHDSKYTFKHELLSDILNIKYNHP